jgi:hypothetical protein
MSVVVFHNGALAADRRVLVDTIDRHDYFTEECKIYSKEEMYLGVTGPTLSKKAVNGIFDILIEPEIVDGKLLLKWLRTLDAEKSKELRKNIAKIGEFLDPDEDFSFIIVTKDSVFALGERMVDFTDSTQPIVVGSGSMSVLTAILAGADIGTAIVVASKTNISVCNSFDIFYQNQLKELSCI